MKSPLEYLATAAGLLLLILVIVALCVCGCRKQDILVPVTNSQLNLERDRLIFEEGVQCGYNASLHFQIDTQNGVAHPITTELELGQMIYSNISKYCPESWGRYYK